MAEELPSHESIEQATHPIKEIIARLPETLETKRAKINLGVVSDYLHEARDRAKCREPQESDTS